MKRTLAATVFAGFLLTLGAAQVTEAKTTFVTIGTGGITGVYYPTGGAIANMVNAKKDQYGIRATVEATGGSVFNINGVLGGDLEFGIAQSDRQFQAYNGQSEWKDKGPQKDLRSVFSIYPEQITLLAAVDAKIDSVADLKGKRVNLGDPGSGNRQNAIDVLEAAGLNYEKDLKAESVKASEAAALVQDEKIDAYFYTVGHPNGSFKEATAGTRKAKFIPITVVDELLKKTPYYAKSFIPYELYPTAENKANIDTIGVQATLITSAKVPDEIVYAITKEVFERLDDFKKLHPAYSTITKESMLQGLAAPIHPGAMKYFKEA
jgi:TRAP transporter TAXI family solute receptor